MESMTGNVFPHTLHKILSGFLHCSGRGWGKSGLNGLLLGHVSGSLSALLLGGIVIIKQVNTRMSQFNS